MSERRQERGILSNLLKRAEKGAESPRQDVSTLVLEKLSALEQEARKLGKAQFKANTIAEDQAARWEKTLAALQAAQEQNSALIKGLDQESEATARHELVAAILPALDGLENAMASGRRYLEKRDLAARKPNLTPQQAILVSPADRAMLAGWLDGLRLVHERLLAILGAGGITPIPAVGHLFDPYLHVAVGTTSDVASYPAPAPGTIVAEERRGYRSEHGVLRYAEVIVYRPRTEGQP